MRDHRDGERIRRLVACIAPAGGAWLAAALLAGLGALAVAALNPYCFSRNRRLVEALDALEDEVAGPPRQP